MMKSRTAFVVIGLTVNLLTLVRGLALMMWLDYAALGLIALVQSVIMFGGMLHFGLLNGGYRLLCHANGSYRQRIVDLAYTFFALLVVVFGLCAIVAVALLDTAQLRIAAGLTAVGAIATLMRAWMINEMVALGKLGSVNLINALSIAASLAALMFLWADPTLIGIFSIVVQPLAFVALAYLTKRAIRPVKPWWSKRLVGVVFRAGFLVFLTGTALQLNTQMERWYVGSYLGLEGLGRLYLVFLFITLFQIPPTLLDQVFLPNVVKARNADKPSLVQREIRLLLAVYVAYCASSVAAVWTLAAPILELILPSYVQDLHWVKLVVPGLVVFTLSNPFALVFNVLMDYRWFVWAYGACTLTIAAAFGSSIALDQILDLDQVMILRSGSFALLGLMLIAGSVRVTARHREFRPIGGLGPVRQPQPPTLP